MNQSETASIVLRRPAIDRYITLAGAVMMLPVAVFMVGASVVSFGMNVWLGVFVLACAAWIGYLTWVCLRELRDRWRVRVEVGRDTVALRLPPFQGRGSVDAVVAFDDIATVEGRTEVFRSMGMAYEQYCYALQLKSGGHVVLGADRPMSQPFFSRTADLICERAEAPWADRGVYDGKGIMLHTSALSAPSWDAAPLPPAVASKRRRAMERTVTIFGVIALLMAALQILLLVI